MKKPSLKDRVGCVIGMVFEDSSDSSSFSYNGKRTEFYDPSQDRDESGRWTGSGGSSGSNAQTTTPKWAQDNPERASKETGEKTTMLYHGTSAQALKSIREQGIKPSKEGVWGGGKVYSTDSMDLAMEYGALRGGKTSKIGGKQLIGIIGILAEGFKSVADNIPSKKSQMMGKTGMAAVSKIFVKDGSVHPRNIKTMSVFDIDSVRKYIYENGSKPKPLAVKNLASEEGLIYVPILIEEPIKSRIAFYDPSQDRDSSGKWTGSGEIMVSPNTKEDMTFPQAVAEKDSPKHAEAVKMAKDIVEKQKMTAEVESGVGDWEDGAEDSIIMKVKGEDFDQIKYTASKLGSKLQQKAVIAFEEKENGNDILHKITSQLGMGEVRKVLTENGIKFRTLVGNEKKTNVTILDQGASLLTKVSNILGALNATAISVRGVGEFIGGDTRADGERAYQENIRSYETKFPTRIHHSLQRGRLHYYRGYTPIEFYDPSQQRDERGRWSGSGGGGEGRATKAQEARNERQAQRLVDKLNRDPKAVDTLRRMGLLQMKVAKDENNKLASVTHWSLRDPSKYKQSSDIVQTFKNPTKETLQNNKKIIASQLNPKAVSENPIAVILMGSPASGKTTVGRPYADKILGGKQVTIIDPDAVKAQLKGYEGWNAGAFHEESSFISEKQIFPTAMGARHNMIIDITGKNTGKVEDMANLLKSWNYKIGIVHVDVDDKTALTRAGKRFAKAGGRYVPYGYIKGSAKQASATWSRLTDGGIVDVGYKIDGNADKSKGQTPRVKETYATAF